MSDQPNVPIGNLPDSDAAPDDIRAKMREALERKHERERAGEAHLDAPDKAHGTHGKSGGGRDFRRKTGNA